MKISEGVVKVLQTHGFCKTIDLYDKDIILNSIRVYEIEEDGCVKCKVPYTIQCAGEKYLTIKPDSDGIKFAIEYKILVYAHADRNTCGDISYSNHTDTNLSKLPKTDCDIPMPDVNKPNLTKFRKCSDKYMAGVVNITAAIVELPDGKIITPKAEDVQFLDPIGE